MNKEYLIYKSCIDRDVNFPPGFLTPDTLKTIIVGLFENGEITHKDVFDRPLQPLFRKLRINRTVSRKFLSYTLFMIEALSNTNGYKDLKPWHFNNIPSDTWDNEDNVKEYIKFIIEKNKLNTDEEIKLRFSTSMVNKKLLDKIPSAWKLLELTYPGKFKEYQLMTIHHQFWENEDNVKEYVKYRLEEIEGLTNIIDIGLNARYTMFHKKCYLNKYSLFELIDLVYPGQLKPWQLYNCPSNFWRDKDNARWYMMWLIRDHYRWSKDEALNNFDSFAITKKSLLNLYTVYELIEMVFPDNNRWDYKKMIKNWTSDNTDEILGQLIDKLKKRHNIKNRSELILKSTILLREAKNEINNSRYTRFKKLLKLECR